MVGHTETFPLGSFSYPMMVSHVTDGWNMDGTGTQGFYVIDIEDRQLDAYFVSHNGVKDAFQILKPAP